MGVFQDLLNLKLLVLMSAPPIHVVTREEAEEGSDRNHSCHSSSEIEQEAY